MNKLATLTLAAAFFLAAGCARKPTLVNWTPIGGSRADATVTIGCIYNPVIETPTVGQNLQDLARQRCRSWGYNDAEVFGEKMQRCTQFDYGPFGLSRCIEIQAHQTFQCIGRGDSALPGDYPASK